MSKINSNVMMSPDSALTNYFSSLNGGIGLNQTQFQQRLNELNSFNQNASFANYNPFLNLNSANGKLFFSIFIQEFVKKIKDYGTNYKIESIGGMIKSIKKFKKEAI